MIIKKCPEKRLVPIGNQLPCARAGMSEKEDIMSPRPTGYGLSGIATQAW